MGRLDIFSAPQGQSEAPVAVGMEWTATVSCQTCDEDVDYQTLYPTEKLLVWFCSQGHKSFIEGYSAF